ncbi:unnamed protein product, partial [marine sediment metagenome]
MVTRTKDMKKPLFPTEIANWINGQERPAISGELFDKLNPANGKPMCRVARSRAEDVCQAVEAAREAQLGWADTPPVKRGHVLHDVAMGLRKHREEVAQIVALETGKSYKSALGETDGAIALGLFMAGEGQRLYGRTTTSGVAHRYAMTIRQPLGVAGRTLHNAQLWGNRHDYIICPLHIFHRRTACADQHWLLETCHVLQQSDVRHITGGYLKGRHIEFCQEIGTSEIEGGSEESDADLLGVP